MKTLFPLLIIIAFCQRAFSTPIEVMVGGYEFPPYVMTSGGSPNGLSLDLIRLLNEQQKEFRFQFVLTSATRRYQDMSEGRFHVILFEDKEWGWNTSQAESTVPFHSGAEVYIAKKKKGRGQSYFDDLRGKRLKGIRGYHYGFLGLSTAPKAARDFNLDLTTTVDGNIQSVLSDRADIALVSKEYLNYYLRKNKSVENKILVSKKSDQTYKLGALVTAKESPISVKDLEKLIAQIEQGEKWKQLFRSTSTIGSASTP